MKKQEQQLPTAADYSTKLPTLEKVLYYLYVYKLSSSHKGSLYYVGRFEMNLLNPLTWILMVLLLVGGVIFRLLITFYEVCLEWAGLFSHKIESVIDISKE